MIVTPIPVQIHLPPSRTVRSEGVHVSSLIRGIATQTGILKPEWAEEVSLVDVRTIHDPVARLRICIGLAWEEFYIGQILSQEDIVDHPGEMECEGIYLTHDAESLSTILKGGQKRHEIVIHEIKATYKSLRTVGDLTDQWMWLTQIKAYCHAAKTRFAQLHALFLCGDYSYPISPQLHRWSIEFSKEELEDTWSLLRDYRDHRVKLEAGSLTPQGQL